MLVFVEGGKVENPEKNPWGKAGTNNKFNPHTCMTPDWYGTQATLIEDAHLYHFYSPKLS